MQANNNKAIEWFFRIAFTACILFPILNYDSHYYYLITLSLTALSFWLYLYKFKIVAILILCLVLFLHFQHWGLPAE